MRNGKKPLSQKPRPQILSEDDIFGNPLALDAELKAEMTKKGLEARFVDYKELVDMGGYHARGWKVYKRDKKEGSDIVSGQDFQMGVSPDGTIRRGSLVLAARPIAIGDKHRALNRQRAGEVAGDQQEAAAEGLRQYARDNRLDLKIEEGYEDEK